MQLRHEIDDKYNSQRHHRRRWELTIEWLGSQFKYDVNYNYLDCGDRSVLTEMLEFLFCNKVDNTSHDLNIYTEHYDQPSSWMFQHYDCIFAFEVIEHLLNVLNFMLFLDYSLDDNGIIFLSTPINRPKFMRNKERHFHEFNRNELYHLIDVAGFKIIDEKVINPNKWTDMFKGFRPFLRYIGFDRTLLLAIRRK